jgi:HTH-type transcriptional regulator/antitoxin HipB
LEPELTQGQLAAACGTGVRLIVDIEHGKPSCQLEKVLLVARMLGIVITAEVKE